GIRDFHVTGVQTCALPIFARFGRALSQFSVVRRRIQRIGSGVNTKPRAELCISQGTDYFLLSPPSISMASSGRSSTRLGFFGGLIVASLAAPAASFPFTADSRSEEHTSELQSRENLVCRLLLEKKKNT